MSTSWNLTRTQLATKVLQKVGTLARNETPDPDDLVLIYDALDALLKELPIYGYSWPALASGQTNLALLAGVQSTPLPIDYYPGSAAINYVDASGQEAHLELITLERWNSIAKKDETAPYPLVGYIDNFNVLRTWPIQNVTRVGKLVYQRVISDTQTVGNLDLTQIWLKGLVYGVAESVGDEFGATDTQILRWGGKWAEARALCIAKETFPSPACISTADGPTHTAGGWPLWTRY